MTGRYLLDTNAAIALLANEPPFQEQVDKQAMYHVCPEVLGELFYGAYRSARFDENVTNIHRLIARCPVLEHDLEVARHYGRIHQYLRQKGRPIPHNDIWVAACAARYELVLLTRDKKHFDEIEDLPHRPW